MFEVLDIVLKLNSLNSLTITRRRKCVSSKRKKAAIAKCIFFKREDSFYTKYVCDVTIKFKQIKAYRNRIGDYFNQFAKLTEMSRVCPKMG